MKGMAMNLQKKWLWVAISLGILSGPALAVPVDCIITPVNSIITEGQTLQLQADCDGALDAINWQMDNTTVTGDVSLTNHVAGQPLYYTTPVGLGGDNTFDFTVTGTAAGANTWGSSTTARVVVKPSSAVVAKAAGSTTPTTPVNGQCGAANNTAVTSMPSNGQQCSSGTPALAISGPTSFTWSCISLNGGLEANCSAVRGYNVTANVSGGNGTASVFPVGVESGKTATVTASPDAGYTPAFASTCGGNKTDANTFVTGSVTAACTVTVSFSNTPVNGACGSASNTTPVASAPSGNLCATGNPTSVAAGTAVSHKYTWGCNSPNTGTSTTATACQAPMGYMVTTSAGSGGTISASKLVAGGTSTTFTVTPSAGNSAAASGCGGSLSGTTYTTGAITGACTVSATFSVAPAGDPGIGKGLYVDPSMPNRTYADQSGTSTMKVSYVPGCLNGLYASSSASGCSVNSAYTGTLYGTSTSHTVAFGGGKQLVLRYKTPATITDNKSIGVGAWNGGNVGVNMRIWLSKDPAATYSSASAECKKTSTGVPTITTGSVTNGTITTTSWTGTTTTPVTYCKLDPNTTYYFGMEYDETTKTSSGVTIIPRWQVLENLADFL
jgi:hypothetical protein